MSDQIVDITFTVKASVSKGRRLFRDTTTGREFWEERRAESREPAEAPAVAEADAPAVPVPAPVKKRRRKSEEGDK